MAKEAPKKSKKSDFQQKESLSRSVIDYSQKKSEPEIDIQQQQSSAPPEVDIRQQQSSPENVGGDDINISGDVASEDLFAQKLKSKRGRSKGPRVYVSYSRKDIAFVQELVSLLEASDIEVWVDWADIPAAADWWKEIEKGIETSQAFILVISPDSLINEVNKRELETALRLDKRLIPIMHREVENSSLIHPRVLAINWVFIRNDDEMSASQDTLIEAIYRVAEQPGGTRGSLNFALNDRPTGPDHLEYSAYAEAFAQVLASPHTKPPLTIGLYASWGMGKSFLMGKIKDALHNRQEEAKNKRKERGGENELVFHHIDFNAWEYSASDNLWAGLITSLYAQVEKAYSRGQLLRFRWSKRFRKKLRATFGWGTLFTIFGLSLALLLEDTSGERLTASLSSLQELFSTAFLSGTTLATFVALLRSMRDLLDSAGPRSKELQAIASRTNFKEKIGFMEEIKSEIGDMLNLIRNIEKGKRDVRFVIFVDDLDRCTPAKAVEVLEAILLLLSYQEGEGPFFIFLAIDARVIVKAIEEHYGKMLTEAGISGYEFLDKIVQIPFRIPPAGPDALKTYVNSLLWQSPEAKEAAEKESAARRAAAPQILAEKTTEFPSEQPGSQIDAALPIQDPGQEDIIASAPAPEPEEPFNEDEQNAFEDFTPFMTPNPRRIKRIVNIYRISRLLLNASGIDFVAREAVIKWVIISEQWPFRTAWLIQQIEDDFQLGSDGLNRKPEAEIVDIYRTVKPKIGDKSTEKLLALDGDPELFDLFIAKAPYITVADIHDVLRPLTFNLNPAMRSEVLRKAALESSTALPESSEKSNTSELPIESIAP